MNKIEELKKHPDLWESINNSNEMLEGDEAPSLTYWQDVWRRFKQNNLSLIGLGLIVFLVIFALVGPLLSPYNYSDQNLEFASIPPKLEIRKLSESTFIYLDQILRIYTVTENGELLDAIKPVKDDFMNKKMLYDIEGYTINIDYNEEPFKITNDNGAEIKVLKKVLNKKYLFGTDDLGRDILIRVIYGARISLIIGLVASIVNLTVGVVYGGIAGYLGGTVDNIMMRIVDIMRSIPRLLYVIIFMIIFGSGLKTVAITIGLVYWLGMARIVRGQVLSLKEGEFILAAKTIGAGTWRILIRHLIPNAMGEIIVVAAMQIPSAIFTEAFLSFVGLGVSAPQASWGTLCNDALASLFSSPYKLLFPATAICLTVLAFNFFGDGLRDSLDPKLRK